MGTINQKRDASDIPSPFLFALTRWKGAERAMSAPTHRRKRRGQAHLIAPKGIITGVMIVEGLEEREFLGLSFVIGDRKINSIFGINFIFRHCFHSHVKVIGELTSDPTQKVSAAPGVLFGLR
jgi:hypothetical protein